MHVALAKKIRISPIVIAKVSIGKNDDENGYMLAVEMDIHVSGISQTEAEELVNMAHHTCPYSMQPVITLKLN